MKSNLHGHFKTKMRYFGSYIVWDKDKNEFSFVAPDYFDIPWANFMSSMWHEIMVEQPCIRCLASSEKLVTMERTGKLQMSAQRVTKLRAEPYLKFLGQRKRKLHAAVRWNHVSSCTPALRVVLSSLPSFMETKSHLLSWKAYSIFILASLHNFHLGIYSLLKNWNLYKPSSVWLFNKPCLPECSKKPFSSSKRQYHSHTAFSLNLSKNVPNNCAACGNLEKWGNFFKWINSSGKRASMLCWNGKLLLYYYWLLVHRWRPTGWQDCGNP